MSTTTRAPRSARPAGLPRRAAAAAALAAATVLLVAGPAAAHVTVQPSAAPKGAADQSFAFRVPNEDDTASTVKVELYFPTDHPIASALIAPVPGWTDQIQTTKLTTPIKTDDGDITDVVSEVTWSGGSIAPGHYQDFTLDFGQLPSDTDQLVFKALQTYSNGTVVRWIDTSQPGQPEPDHPAPTLKLTAAAADPDTSAAPAAPVRSASADDSTARGLGIAGLVVGALGLGAAAFFGLRRRPGGDPAA
ncbi:YcnI family protein [Kitasatospora sp. NPDC008050]|uniref:YcnI family copper-binding membrane protein n=1 Tax=Kitasatospora sp. NPDC008050 TaxID=3364021 RepID=UPI0036E88FB4